MPDYPAPIATVDIVLLTLQAGRLSVALLPREAAPFMGMLALPGGFVHADAGLEDAARRVLQTKAGLLPRYLEQLGSFGGPERDPRGWSISVSYYVLLGPEELADAKPGLALFPTDGLPELPFDHAAIIQAALRRLQTKSAYSSLPAFLLPPLFTLTELHQVYQQVIGTRLDVASFRRKIEEQRIIERADGARREGAHRPAQLFRLAPGVMPEFDRRI